MNSLQTNQPRWLAASSSQRVEELAGRSGLPLQASIAGCISSRWHPSEWEASVQRLGQECNRVEEMLPQIVTLMEVTRFQRLASTLLENVSAFEAGHAGICGSCLFLTSAHHAGVPAAFGHAYVVQLKRTDRVELEPRPTDELILNPWEPIVPDADRAYTVEQMAQAWKSIGREITKDDVPLSVDPDEYPLF